jgi:hypothetical protein
MIEDGSLLRSAPGRVRLRRHSGRPPDLVSVPPVEPSVFITEDAVKEAVKRSLEAAGWTVLVRWGRERGIDIEATRGDERLVLEAKGETTPGPQQVSYFVGAIVELVQRVSDPVRATT